MARTIHCTVVEVPAARDPYLPPVREFHDLVPWADPYIAALLTKLERTAATNRLSHYETVSELPPPLDDDDRQDGWLPDWSEGNWPRDQHN